MMWLPASNERLIETDPKQPFRSHPRLSGGSERLDLRPQVIRWYRKVASLDV